MRSLGDVTRAVGSAEKKPANASSGILRSFEVREGVAAYTIFLPTSKAQKEIAKTGVTPRRGVAIPR